MGHPGAAHPAAEMRIAFLQFALEPAAPGIEAAPAPVRRGDENLTGVVALVEGTVEGMTKAQHQSANHSSRVSFNQRTLPS